MSTGAPFPPSSRSMTLVASKEDRRKSEDANSPPASFASHLALRWRLRSPRQGQEQDRRDRASPVTKGAPPSVDACTASWQPWPTASSSRIFPIRFTRPAPRSLPWLSNRLLRAALRPKNSSHCFLV